eukprot:COSAG02_NODE_56828_length_283_cov_1.119565_1_plen_51_part_01
MVIHTKITHPVSKPTDSQQAQPTNQPTNQPGVAVLCQALRSNAHYLGMSDD